MFMLLAEIFRKPRLSSDTPEGNDFEVYKNNLALFLPILACRQAFPGSSLPSANVCLFGADIKILLHDITHLGSSWNSSDTASILSSMSRLESQRFQHGQRSQDSHGNSFEEDIAWTTARCSRLLRTITSRIEAIRGLIRQDLGSEKSAPKPQTRVSKRKPQSATDPAWLPTGTKRPTVRTYAAKKRTKVARNVRSDVKSGEAPLQKIILPSPFLRRVGNPDLALDSAEETPQIRRSVQFPQRQRQPLSVFTRYEDPLERAEFALQGAFQLLLRTTRHEEVGVGCGASSLLNTCLRQVPQYLDTFVASPGDEECNSVEADLTETWSFFDDLLEVKGTSWHGLREVVRSQAINAIRHAIVGGILRDECIEGLVSCCRGRAALSVAEDLLHAWFERYQSLTPLHFRTLQSIARDAEARGTRFRVLIRFIDHDSSRIRSLLTTGRHIWNDLLRAVTDGAQIDALRFLQICIKHQMSNSERARARDPKQEQIDRNLIEVASKLWVMSFTGLSIHKSSVLGLQLQEELCRLATTLSMANSKAVAKLGASWALGPVVLTVLMGGPLPVESRCDALSKLYEHVARNPFHSRAAKRGEQDFASTIAADFYSLYTSEGGRTVMRALIPMRKHIEKYPSSIATDVLRHIITEIATLHRTEGMRQRSPGNHLLSPYLAVSALAARTSDPFPKTPKAKSANYGWDDGLCEWIARTPFTKPRPSSEPSHGGETLELDKENQVPETPDVLAGSVVKMGAKRKASNRSASPRWSSPQSPQVVIARPAKRRTLNRVEARRAEAESEDELAM